MSAERRGEVRKRVLRRGRIVARGGYCSIPCLVVDISPRGARLKLDAWLAVPDRFDLRLEDGAVYPAEVLYRRADIAGIRFAPAGA